MADNDVGTLAQTHRMKAGRYALATLYGSGLTSQAKVTAMMPALRSRWRGLVSRLADTTYDVTDTPQKRWFLTNCPSFGVFDQDGKPWPPKRTCNRPLLCPFCYAREYVFNAYDRLLSAMAWEKKNTRVLYATSHSYEIDVSSLGLRVATRAAHTAVKGPDRRTEVDLFEPLGAVVFHRLRLKIGEVEVPKPKDAPEAAVYTKPTVVKLTVVRTTLAVSTPRKKMPFLEHTTAERIDNPTKKDLAEQLGRHFAYPAEWYRAPGEDIRALATMLVTARVFDSYGSCRQPRKTKPKSPTTQE